MEEAFKALSDSTRRQILHLLRHQDLTAGEIAAHFQMSKPSISYHLNTLKHAGLVFSQRQGQMISYSLNKEAIEEMVCLFSEVLK